MSKLGIFLLTVLLLLSIGVGSFFIFQESASPEPVTSTNDFDVSFGDWAAFGDTRGYVEPCGCNPATDLGGLVRLQSWLLAETQKGSRPVFCLGNMFPGDAEKPQNIGKVEFVDSFLREVQKSSKVLPCLVGALEWKNRKFLGQRLDGFVLSNHESKPSQFRSHLRLKNAVVFGFLEDVDLAGADETLLEKLRGMHANEETKSEGQLKKVLLFNGSDPALDFFEKSQWFDVILSANTNPLGVEPDKKEKEKPGLLLRSGQTYMVPSFAQGILQNVLSTGDTVVKEDIRLFGQKGEDSKKPKIFLGLRSPVVWLGKDDVNTLADNDPVSNQYKRYNDMQADIFGGWIESRQGETKNSKTGLEGLYVGAEACKSCHSDAYKVWSDSKHTHAFETLENKSKHQDLECISCHVVGFDDPAGFPALPKDKWQESHLKNVQCESCHGPRGEHIQNPSKETNRPNPKEVCVSCHHPPHTTDFEYKTRWEKIQHGHNK